MLLTVTAIKNAEPKTRPYKLSDGEGLYLLVQPTGSKLWRFKYRFGGRENTLAIGKYPQVSLLEARDSRYDAKKLLRENVNPGSRKKEVKRANLFDTNNTFRAVALDWFNSNRKKWEPEHAERIWRRLELHALPYLSSQPITQIRTPDLVILLRKLEKKKKPETTRRLMRSLHMVFRHAIHCGILEHNPAADLKGIIIPPKTTHFAAIHPTELPEFLQKLEVVDTSMQSRIAVKLLLNTFLRPGELRYGKWSEIDWQNKTWNIPSERMKKRRPHVVPLSKQAISLLTELKQITGYSDFLFPSQQRRRHPVMSENTINKIIKNMGYAGRQVGHGFRAIASTVLNESAQFRTDVIEMQLAHVEENSSRKPYNRAEYLEERTQMMQWWGIYLSEAINKTVKTNRSLA